MIATMQGVHCFTKPKQLLKISPSNAKIGYESLSLLSGHSCPFALDCLAKVDLKTFKIIDGKDAEFRCFSARLQFN